MIPTVRLTCYPRLHLGLLDTAGVSRRAFGGAGFALDGPATVVTAQPADRTQVIAPDLSSDERERLATLVNTFTGSGLGTEIGVRLGVPRHVGLGTGTMLAMATLTATNAAHELARSQDQIALATGRGGASGVGWHAFWQGGFIIDVGQPQRGQELRPSSASRPSRPPPLLVRLPIPESWRFTLLLPHAGRRVHGSREASFFAANTPTKPEETLDAFVALYHSVAAGVATDDLSSLRAGLADYQRLGFKRLEIAAQSPDVNDLLADLGKIDSVAAGMSSMGPLVFAIHNTADKPARDAIHEVTMRHAADLIADVGGRNLGFGVQPFATCTASGSETVVTSRSVRKVQSTPKPRW